MRGSLLPTARRRSAPLLAAALVLLVGTACAKPRAAAVPMVPPLAVPEAPARAVAPPDEPLPIVATVPDGPVPTPAATPVAPRPPAPRRTGPPAAEPEPRADAAPTTPDPSRELRPGSQAADAQAERAVRETLARSNRDLGRINPARLSADGRTQYEQARRFAQQAEQALATRNVIFAATLADKAASLAAELVGR